MIADDSTREDYHTLNPTAEVVYPLVSNHKRMNSWELRIY
jgi:hypothetical protein